MGRALKIIGVLFAVVVVLIVGAVVYITTVVDPNDYKEQIAEAVGESTGRQLTLEGDLELSVFPSLRIAIGPAQLSNADGFADAPFARIGGAELQVALMPLLSERLEIGRATLSGLQLNLARDAQGRNNWQDLNQREADSADPDPDINNQDDSRSGR